MSCSNKGEINPIVIYLFIDAKCCPKNNSFVLVMVYKASGIKVNVGTRHKTFGLGFSVSAFGLLQFDYCLLCYVVSSRS